MKIQLYMNIKSFCYNINTNGNIYIIISNKTQSFRRMCHKTCAHILQRKAANVTTPPPQQAQRAIEHDSPQHPQRRWCSPRGCPFASVRKIEVPRIFYVSCLVLVTVSLFDETKVCAIIRIIILVHTSVQVHLHTIWGVPHWRQATRAGTADASVPARPRPSTPHDLRHTRQSKTVFNRCHYCLIG